MSPTFWWIVGIVVALAIIAVLARMQATKRTEGRREEAAALRDQASEHERTLRERTAAADESQAQARKAQAEADEQAARAKQLQAEAERRTETADEARATHEDHLRRADALDPDVRTDKEGYRLDDDGNRATTAVGGSAGAAGAGEAGAYAGSHTDSSLEDSSYTGIDRTDTRDVDGGDGADGADTAYDRKDPTDTHGDTTAHGTIDSVDGYDESRREVSDTDGDGDVDTRTDVERDEHTDAEVATDDANGDGKVSLGERIRNEVDDARGVRDSEDDGRRG